MRITTNLPVESTGRAGAVAGGIVPALILLLGCSEGEPTPVTGVLPADGSTLSVQAETRSARVRRSRGIEDVHLDIETRVPGFGGFFADQDGGITAFVTDLARAADARTEIRAALDARVSGWPIGVQIHVLQGDFSISQLTRWQDLIGDHATLDDGISIIDADEMKNRVRVGVIESGSQARVEALAQRVGVPVEAIFVELMGERPRTLQSLTAWWRPLRGGLQIHPGPCSLGLNVGHPGSGTQFFLTAGHCTDNFAGPTGLSFWQPTVGMGSFAGWEAANPPWSTTCATGIQYCRDTDVVLVGTLESTLNEVFYTTTWGSLNLPGSSVIGGAYALNTVVLPAVQGQSVMKTGHVTGTTQGPIVRGTCVRSGPVVHHLSSPPPDSVFLEVLCSNEVQMLSLGGDSGGSVFRLGPLVFNPPILAEGVVWGGFLHHDGLVRTLYNALDAISLDFGLAFFPGY